MSFRIDDDENRIQDLKDQIDQLEIQTFSPEVVARNESTRDTGIQTGDSAATNAYPQWIPIRDFGNVGLVTQEIVLNRVDSHIAKMTIIGDVDFAFSIPPPTNKMMWFILDVTIDNVGGYTINLLNNILPAGITIGNTANARTVLRFTTTDGGVTYYAEDLSVVSGGGGPSNVPDPTAEFQHLQSDAANNWIAQQELEFGVNSATSAEINIPNNVIGLAWRNATNDGNIELKVTTAGILDVTRDDNTAMTFTVRSQNAIEVDQSLSITVGSGSVTSADIVIDASTSKLLFAVGGATRLTLDVLANTALILKSPSGITAQSNFSVISTHVTEADQSISIFVGSGDSADAVLFTSAAIFKLAVNNTVRWELDVNIGNEITQTGFGVNPLYTLFNDDSTPNDFDLLGRINFSGRNSNADKIIYAGILVESTSVIDNAEEATMLFNIISAGIISPKFTLDSDGMVLANGSMKLDEILLPANPAANTGVLYLRDVAGITTPFFLDSSGTETSMIASGGSSNQIIDADSNLTVTDGVGFGFTLDGLSITTLTSSEWLFGVNLDINGNNIINANSVDTDGLGVNNTLTSLGQTNLNGNTLLGDFSTDNITGFAGVARDWLPDVGNIRVLGDTTNNWSSLSVGRTNYIFSGALSGRMLVDGNGVEIEAILSGDFIELKTQGNVRANFKAEADGGITFFEPFEINDEMRIDGGNIIRAHDSAQCGFSVTDENTSPGTEGTLQMPRTSDTTPTASELDADFGSALGNHGLATLGGLPSVPLFVIKVDTSPSTWRGFLMPPSGNVTAIEFT